MDVDLAKSTSIFGVGRLVPLGKSEECTLNNNPLGVVGTGFWSWRP